MKTARVGIFFVLRYFFVCRRLEGDPDACAPAIQLVYEVVAEEAMLFILPINLLRNIAILPARTPLVAMIDIDLLVSKDFSNIVAQPERCGQGGASMNVWAPSDDVHCWGVCVARGMRASLAAAAQVNQLSCLLGL